VEGKRIDESAMTSGGGAVLDSRVGSRKGERREAFRKGTSRKWGDESRAIKGQMLRPKRVGSTTKFENNREGKKIKIGRFGLAYEGGENHMHAAKNADIKKKKGVIQTTPAGKAGVRKSTNTADTRTKEKSQ